MAIETAEKGLIGANDINWDLEGLGANFNKRASKKKSRTDNFVNASQIPVLLTTRLLKYADQTTPQNASELFVDQLLVKILGNLENIGLPSSTFFDINAVGGELTIKTNSITATQIALATITEANLANGAVTNAKLGADAVDGSKIADDAVDSEHLAAGGIDHEHFSLDCVGRENLDFDNAGSQPDVYPVWGEVERAVSTAAVNIVFSGISAQKTITVGMGVVANFGATNAGGLAIESAYVSAPDEVTIVCTGATTVNDTINYQVFEKTVDKT